MKELRLLDLSYSLFFPLVFLWIFLSAYFHPSKSVVVTVNQFGEANLELVLFVGGFILNMYYLYKRNVG